MKAIETTRALSRFGVDAALWLTVPAGFLYLYVSRYAVPANAVLPHLHIVGLTLAVFALARIGLAASFPTPSCNVPGPRSSPRRSS